MIQEDNLDKLKKLQNEFNNISENIELAETLAEEFDNILYDTKRNCTSWNDLYEVKFEPFFAQILQILVAEKNLVQNDYLKLAKSIKN